MDKPVREHKEQKQVFQHGAKLLSDFTTQNDHQERID
jgi:hypothetical protein